jgi:hypothetical protein
MSDTKQWRHHEDTDEKQASGRGLGWKHCIIGKADVECEDERFRAGYFGLTFDLHVGAQATSWTG